MDPPPEEAAPQLTDTWRPPLGGLGETLMLDGGSISNYELSKRLDGGLTVMAVRSEYQ